MKLAGLEVQPRHEFSVKPGLGKRRGRTGEVDQKLRPNAPVETGGECEAGEPDEEGVSVCSRRDRAQFAADV